MRVPKGIAQLGLDLAKYEMKSALDKRLLTGVLMRDAQIKKLKKEQDRRLAIT